MSSDIKRYGDSGVHTVEGNIAGARAARLAQQREQEKRDYQERKKAIESEHAKAGALRKFASYSDQLEAEFKRQTVGLVTADEFRKRRSQIDLEVAKEASSAADGAASKKKKAKKQKRAVLSFADDEEEQENEEKNELESQSKAELLEVTYSYWDGSGHRRVITVTKGTTVGKFLEKARQELVKEFPELRTVNSDYLIYIKEDLIIPHHYSFYDLIVTKARGKSGPLFHFDVHEDVRLINDARIEKDESHPGKIAERRWYERNKHIFPASRWEVYDPSVKRDKYTIHGDEVNVKT